MADTSTKFGRNYKLAVQATTGETLNITLPFTVEFDISRNTFSSTNTGRIRIYNLSPKNRNLVRKNVIDLDDIRSVSLKAGYGTNLPEIFTGNITQAWSVREHNNFITQVESLDGGFAFANSNTNSSFPANTPMPTILQTIAGDLQYVAFGAIGSGFNGSIGARGNSYSGNTASILTELSNGQFFIDNGKAYFLGISECIQGQIQVINSSAGLLGTPLREQSFISFDLMFEPRVICGQYLRLESGTDASFNGEYKVVAVKHRGMISPSVCGEAITSLVLDASGQALSVVNAA